MSEGRYNDGTRNPGCVPPRGRRPPAGSADRRLPGSLRPRRPVAADQRRSSSVTDSFSVGSLARQRAELFHARSDRYPAPPANGSPSVCFYDLPSRELLKELVPRVGFEPTAYRLRSGCSTAELSGLYRLQPVPAYYPIARPEPSGSGGCADTTGGSGESIAGSISGAVPVAV